MTFSYKEDVICILNNGYPFKVESIENELEFVENKLVVLKMSGFSNGLKTYEKKTQF